MRYIDRHSIAVPEVLASEAARRRYEALVAQINTLRDAPTRRISIDRHSFQQPDVVHALHTLFQDKCAYCETPVQSTTIDHFRPISAAANLDERDSSLLHYSWLAYEWRNLYLSCRECNARKRNRFPVIGPRAPMLYGLEEVRECETALLVDPCFDDPDRSLLFELDGRCLGKNPQGRHSIEVFGLNRIDLVDARNNLFAEAVETLSSSTKFNGEDLFDPTRPHIGALENFARNACVILARHHGVRPPSRNARLNEFARLLQATPRDTTIKLLSARAEETAPKLVEQVQRSPVPVVSTKYRLHELDQRIAHVEIQNFKGIDHLDFHVGRVGPDSKSASALMLLADNAAGKTSVLQAIALAVMGPERAGQLKLDAARLIRNGAPNRWGQITKAPAEVKVTFNSGETAEIVLNPFNMEFSGTGQSGDGLMAYGAHRLLGDRKRRGASATARVASLFDSRATIPHPDSWLGRTPQFEPVARALAELLVLQTEDALIRDDYGQVLVKTYGQPTPIDALSDGYRSVIAVAVDTIRWLLADWGDLETARGIVLIDEVDAHLHPRWKLQIMSALRTAMPQVQFIATTHDPLCLRGMGRGEVIVMKRSHEQRIDLVRDLPDFSSMSAEQLLMSDYFGLNTTSDPAVDVALGRLADGVSTAARKTIGEVFDAMMIGSSPERQIAETAMLRYLRERRSAAGEAVSEGRREAIDAALAAIRASGHVS